MRLSTCVLFGVMAITAASCGDDDRPDISIETRVPASTIAAGDPINARCAVLDPNGEPALDERGEPLTDSTMLVISYQHEDSFATDDVGQPIARRVGTATVRCSAPALDLVGNAVEITIEAGPPRRVFTQLERAVPRAGEPVGVDCVSFDAFDNPIGEVAHTLGLSPSGAGTTTTGETVRATVAGEYEVTCIVDTATEVEPALLSVVPALPAKLFASLAPERIAYSIGGQVTLVANAFDEFENRVDEVAYAYRWSPGVTSPSQARFRFGQDGPRFELTATVTSPTHQDIPLSVTVPVTVDSTGPAIECMRIDAPNEPSDSYMMQAGPSTALVPVRVSDTGGVRSVTINGVQASLGDGLWRAAVPLGFGMNFFDVVAVDSQNKENSTTCFALVGEHFTPEFNHMLGAVGLRLDPNAIGNAQPDLSSINGILQTILRSDRLRQLVDQGLAGANPLSDGGCGVFACSPRITYNGGSLSWSSPTSSLALVPGGLTAQVTIPNVRLAVRACGTACCPGGSTVTVTSSLVRATVGFSLQLQGGVLRAAVTGTPNVEVATPGLDGSGFCGIIVDIIEGILDDIVRDKVREALAKFIQSDVGPVLDQLVSSLDITTLGTSFAVPRLDSTGNVNLGFGLVLSSFDITPARAALGIGTRFAPGVTAHNRPSLGIARRTPDPLLDPPGTHGGRPVGVSFYEGALNHVLHSLWRGGYFQANLSFGSGTAAIDARLPPVVALTSANTASIMLGGVQAKVRIPGFIDTPITILFGGRASLSVNLVGNDLRFGGFTLDELSISVPGTSLEQDERDALETLLRDVLQDVLVDAVNTGLPAVPIPSFALPASAGPFGLPVGAQLGITNPALDTSGAHEVLTGGFGVRN